MLKLAVIDGGHVRLRRVSPKDRPALVGILLLAVLVIGYAAQTKPPAKTQKKVENIKTSLTTLPESRDVTIEVMADGSTIQQAHGLIKKTFPAHGIVGEEFGAERVIDMPLCESGLVGFSLGASQTGGEPILEGREIPLPCPGQEECLVPPRAGLSPASMPDTSTAASGAAD